MYRVDSQWVLLLRGESLTRENYYCIIKVIHIIYSEFHIGHLIRLFDPATLIWQKKIIQDTTSWPFKLFGTNVKMNKGYFAITFVIVRSDYQIAHQILKRTFNFFVETFNKNPLLARGFNIVCILNWLIDWLIVSREEWEYPGGHHRRHRDHTPNRVRLLPLLTSR